ncbi:DUF6683 family protein [Rhodoferax sp.]|uniref:DUF6683 family protein n=1 Tax=Rhodoferax sp. TaxID=50421 RepID=UPI0027787D51|nr:hypothetical protein [Rhodoferax sp.]
MKRITNTMTASCAMALICGMTHGLAQAQYMSGYSASNLYGPNAGITMSMMHSMSERAMYANMIKNSAAKSTGSAKPSAATPAAGTAHEAPHRALTETDFKPAGPRTVAEEIAAKVADPLERQKVVQICRQILAAIEATPGFRKNNLASAITVLLGVSQQVLTGQELDDAQAQALMQVINDDIVGSGAVAGWSNARRTYAYDSMVITGGLIAGMAHNGAESGDKALTEQAKRMARDAMANLKVKP